LNSSSRTSFADVFAGTPECWLIVPEGNGKSTLIAGLALYHSEHKPNATVPVAASSRDQAEIIHKQAEGFVLRTPALHAEVPNVLAAAKGKRKADVPRFVCLEGYRRISHHKGGRIQVFAADDRTATGSSPRGRSAPRLPGRASGLGQKRAHSGSVSCRQTPNTRSRSRRSRRVETGRLPRVPSS
jgi:hypothetical protein